MALIKCSECSRDVSDKAAACVHCGCPLSYSVCNVQSNNISKCSFENKPQNTLEDFTEADIKELLSVTDEMNCSEVKRRAEVIRDSVGFTSIATRFTKQHGKAHIVGKTNNYYLIPIISKDGKFALNVGKDEYCNWIPDNERVNIYGEMVIGHKGRAFNPNSICNSSAR